jgi:cysteine desulfurase/selenocysteine lyase
MKVQLQDQIALVTGAAGAIGQAICASLAANGAKVIYADINLEGARQLAAGTPGAMALRMDVTDEREVESAISDMIAAHGRLDVNLFGADFVVFSAHKMYGPTGIGALWGTTEIFAEMPVVLTGGAMITRVDYDSSDYLPAPAKFEPGTPRLTQAIGWAESLRYVDSIGVDAIAAHEEALGADMFAGVADIPNVRILGTADGVHRVGLVSFAVEGVHPHDVGQYLDSRGIAARVGHHCAQPLHKRLGVDSSTRFSLGMYSTSDDVALAVAALSDVRQYFGEG